MAAAGKHYDLMTLDDICALPVRRLFGENGALFLWATSPRLHFAIQAIEAWGLCYRGVAWVWVKTRADGKIINGQGVPPTFTKPTTEYLLSATVKSRGRPFKLHDLAMAQVVLAPREAHSCKPEIFRRNIDALCGRDKKRIELFARRRACGWSAWGDEI